MTTGLLGYSAYLPRYALSRKAVAEALGRDRGPPGCRALASYDEDSISMGVEAARRLGRIRDGADRLYFATSSPPFLDKTNAAVVQAATQATGWALGVDLSGLRSGFAALRCASDTGGLAVLSDLRTGRPGAPEEIEGGDGAAAFLFGESDDVIAEMIAATSLSAELMDAWRTPDKRFSQTWEERFIHHVHHRAIQDVVARVMAISGLTQDPTYILVSARNHRFAAMTASRIGCTAGSEIQEQHREHIGYCGAADVGLLLSRTLDRAHAGETILLVSAAGGVDAVVLRVLRDGTANEGQTEDIRERRELSYITYLTWRGLLTREPSRRPERSPVSAPAAYRNQGWKYRLDGSRCGSCGKVYLPPQRVCGGCGSVDAGEPYSAADRLGTVAALSTDTMTDNPAPPAMLAVVDFEAGGRLRCELTETTPGQLRIGDPVEMTFRRTHTNRGTPDYFWKARPKRGTKP